MGRKVKYSQEEIQRKLEKGKGKQRQYRRCIREKENRKNVRSESRRAWIRSII